LWPIVRGDRELTVCFLYNWSIYSYVDMGLIPTKDIMAKFEQTEQTLGIWVCWQIKDIKWVRGWEIWVEQGLTLFC